MILNRRKRISVLTCVGYLLTSLAFAQSPVMLKVDTEAPGTAIPSDFLGLSFAEANLQSNGVGVSGYMFDSTNTQLVTLFKNLGIKSLRIGGTAVDRANPPALPQYMPTNQDIDALFRFAQAAGVQVILSVRLENGDSAQDAAVASYTWTNYHQYLTCFAIGNEPDGYHGGDPAITNFSSYLAKWTSFADAITDAVPEAKFGGPDSAGPAWASLFANAEVGSSSVTRIFSHDYVAGSSGGLTATQVIAGMLSPNLDASKCPAYYNVAGAVAVADGFPYRLTEFNSYTAAYPGVWGGNNSFASALFAVDCAHWWAEHNCGGVNFHTYLGKYNGTIYYDTNGNYQIYPIAYGIKAFDVGSHGDVMPLTISNADGLNLTAYAVGDSTNLYVSIINKEYGTGARDASVTIVPEAFVTGTVAAMYLVATNGGVAATSGITLGGASITNNAPWLGQWTALTPLVNGQCVVTVPASSAAIVKIQATTLYAPPVIVQNLPAQVPLVAGKTYDYTVEVKGAEPMSYQWYENTKPMADATNASYMTAAGKVGNMASYDVVITNIYGAVTSAVSTVTVVAPLTNFYARQVLSYDPVGYWPLAETNVPAAMTMETNYGTLGALGNAYYAVTNPTDAAFGQGGAIAGDNDPAVTFYGNGNNGTADSYLFVPRLAPALTLVPPLTVECWVNPSSAAVGAGAGDLVSEGGSNANGDSSYSGFRLSYTGNQTGGPSLAAYFYYPGGGSGYHELHMPPNLLTAGSWHYCVMTYDGTNAHLYVDGTQISSNMTTEMTTNSVSPLTIGAGRWLPAARPSPANRAFDGLMDEVAIYTNVLSISNIAAHYQAGTAGGSSSYNSLVLADHPLLYYRMDCAGYTNPPVNLDPAAMNYGSAPVNGTYLAGTVPGGVSGPPIAVLGANTVAAPINGVFSCVDAGKDPAFNPIATQPFTAMIWFRAYPSDGRMQTIMGHGGNTSWALKLDGATGTVIWSNGAGSVASTNILNDGDWHLVAGVYGGTENYLYVDGTLNNSAPATGSLAGDSNADLYLGGDADYTLVGDYEQYLAGAIAQAAFFTNALTAAQFQQIYKMAGPITVNLNPTNLVFSATGNELTLSWPVDHLGWMLQAQTNRPSAGLGTNWVDVGGSTATNQIVIPIHPTDGSVFYRLVYPPQ